MNTSFRKASKLRTFKTTEKPASILSIPEPSEEGDLPLPSRSTKNQRSPTVLRRDSPQKTTRARTSVQTSSIPPEFDRKPNTFSLRNKTDSYVAGFQTREVEDIPRPAEEEEEAPLPKRRHSTRSVVVGLPDEHVIPSFEEVLKKRNIKLESAIHSGSGRFAHGTHRGRSFLVDIEDENIEHPVISSPSRHSPRVNRKVITNFQEVCQGSCDGVLVSTSTPDVSVNKEPREIAMLHYRKETNPLELEMQVIVPVPIYSRSSVERENFAKNLVTATNRLREKVFQIANNEYETVLSEYTESFSAMKKMNEIAESKLDGVEDGSIKTEKFTELIDDFKELAASIRALKVQTEKINRKMSSL